MKKRIWESTTLECYTKGVWSVKIRKDGETDFEIAGWKSCVEFREWWMIKMVRIPAP